MPRTFWLRVRSRGLWQWRCLCPACPCPCMGGLGLVLRSTARAGSPSSMASSCSSGSASVSLASDEDGLMGSSFSHSTSAPVREGWTEPPEGQVGPGHRGLLCARAPPSTGSRVCGEGRGQCLTGLEEQFGEGGGAQAGSQVQGGVLGEGWTVDICSQL